MEKELLLFNDLQPQGEKEAVGVATDKGIVVALEEYYRLIGEAGYGKLSPEDTADFLGKLKAAGRVEDIKKYFVTTLRHPYLCRTWGDKEAFTDEEYTRYFYTAVVVHKVNAITHYYGHAIQKIHEGILLALIRGEEYEAAVNFAASAAEMRARLGEEAYRAIVPSLDDIAKNIGEGRYLEYVRRRGNYKVNAARFIDDLKQHAKTGTVSIAAVKTATVSNIDAARALDAEAFIMKDVVKLMQSAKEKAEENRRVFSQLYTAFLRSLKKKEVREAFTAPFEANIVRRALDDLTTYEDSPVNRSEYIHNLIDYGNNSYYVLKKVDEYKKSHNEKGIL